MRSGRGRVTIAAILDRQLELNWLSGLKRARAVDDVDPDFDPWVTMTKNLADPNGVIAIFRVRIGVGVGEPYSDVIGLPNVWRTRW